MILFNSKEGSSERGSALVLCVLVVSAVAVMSLSLATTSLRSSKERKQAQANLNAVYIAESGVRMAAMELSSGREGDLGNEDEPISYGTGTFNVDTTTLASGVIQVLSTGTENGSSVTIEVMMERNSTSPFQWAAFGDESMVLDSNALVDSYDSSLGTYDTQDVNGSGSDTYALSNGDIGSNQDIEMYSNTLVYGDATPGVGYTTTVTGNAEVSGSESPATEVYTMDALDFPVFPSSGDLMASGSSTLASGDYYFSTLNLDGNSKLVITGPATIVVDDMIIDSNSELIVDATNGPVAFWVYNDFTMNSNTLIASSTLNPADIQINLDADNILDPGLSVDVDVSFDSNAKLYGTIYAPNASIDINSNFELFGSIVAQRVNLDSNSKVHFDENLLNLGSAGSAAFNTLGWRIVGN